MSRFFIERPIFAWVIAIFITLGGVIAYYTIPVEQYPSIASPAVQIRVTYPGASAKTIDENVINVIENELIGIEGLDYTKSNSDAVGTGTIDAVFKPGTDIQFAQVEVQNRIATIERRLPASVRDNGVVVRKSANNFLSMVSFSVKNNPGFTKEDLGDWLSRTIVTQIARIDGVGNVQLFSAPKAMRIWLDPLKMKSLNLSTAEVEGALKDQNIYITAGSLGSAPMVAQQKVIANVNVPSILETTADFENLVIKQGPNKELIRLRDVARVELGKTTYSFVSTANGRPNVGIMIEKTSDGNAINTANAVKAKLKDLEPSFPQGVFYEIPYDTSDFVKASVSKVQHTLIEAFLLVCIVMILFLHRFRYALIPMIVVPISLFGANVALLLLGMSMNILSMFAMVLVIGIVVDDAIVVVENVERIMKEEHLPPKEATIKAMGQISGAIVGITLILISVFLPMMLFTGATGNIYKQFSIVMSVAIATSGFMALSLTPALCATLLKPLDAEGQRVETKPSRFPVWTKIVSKFQAFLTRFEALFTRLSKRYLALLTELARQGKKLMGIFYAVILLTVAFLFWLIPAGYLPDEDQNVLILITQLDSKTPINITEAKLEKFTHIFLQEPAVKSVMAIAGFSFAGVGENYGIAFIPLKPWDERSISSFKLMAKLQGIMFQDKDSLSFIVNPPAIPELGLSNQLEIVIEDRADRGLEELKAARSILMMTMFNPAVLKAVNSPQPSGKGDQTVLKIDIDKDLMTHNGVNMGQVAHTLYSELGTNYVNDFPYKGKMQRVILQAEAASRKNVADAMQITVPTKAGIAIPLSTFATSRWAIEPADVSRYNGFPSLSLKFNATKGSGPAMSMMENLAAKYLPPGFGYEWTGLASDQQKAGNESFILYALSVIAVFLCLAALYESWRLPFTVILVMPLGILGILLGVSLTYIPSLLGFAVPAIANGIYFKIGMITIMGLSAKNAILIIEFAKDLHAEGNSVLKAVITAAQLRFRPIIMTSMAFIAGVVPMVLASGASSSAQHEIGTVVFFGMLIGTFLAVFFVPMFYLWIEKDSEETREIRHRT